MFKQNTRRASAVLKAMGNERRLLILHLLASEGEKRCLGGLTLEMRSVCLAL